MSPLRVVILTVLLVAVGAALVKGCAESGDKNPVASVDNGAPRGLLALRLLLVQRGVPTSVRRLPADPAPVARALVIVPPPESSSVSDTEAQELIRHAEQGGVVLVVCDDDEPRTERLKGLLRLAGAECFAADVPLGDVAETLAQPVVPGVTQRLEVRGLGRARMAAKTPSVPLARVGSDPFLVSRAFGDGRVIVMGSATPLANDGLALRDNAALVLELAVDRPVQVDERLHRGRGGNVLALASARGLGPTTLFLGVALLIPLSLLSLAPRRGDLPRRGSTDGAPAAAGQARALAALLALARKPKRR